MRPDPAIRAVLVYGPDRGLVSERARDLVRGTGLDMDDPFALVRLDAAEVESGQGRLREEVNGISMFAERRVVWVRGAGASKALAAELKSLLDEMNEDVLVIIEAGDEKKGAPLRAACEAHPRAISLPCYADDERAIDALIDRTLGADGLAIAADARLLLRRSLGGDRLATRQELEKIALYCRGAKEIRVEDVEAVSGDSSAMSTDRVIDAILSGNAAALQHAFDAWVTAGSAPYLLLSAGMRQFEQLQRLRAGMRDGRSVAQAVAAARPPVFFSRRRLVEQALASWSEDALAKAADRIYRTILESRLRPSLETALARQALLAIAVQAARNRAARQAR